MEPPTLEKVKVSQRFDFMSGVAAATVSYGGLTCAGTLRCLNEHLLERPLSLDEINQILKSAERSHSSTKLNYKLT